METGKWTLIGLLDQIAGENVSDSLLGYAVAQGYKGRDVFEALDAEKQVGLLCDLIDSDPGIMAFWAWRNGMTENEQEGRVRSVIFGFES